jgi:hypothetical protein
MLERNKRAIQSLRRLTALAPGNGPSRPAARGTRMAQGALTAAGTGRGSGARIRVPRLAGPGQRAQRLLGKKTMEPEILRGAVSRPQARKKHLLRSTSLPRRRSVTAVADAIGISR